MPAKKSNPLAILAGKRIQEIRKARGLSQDQLGKRLGLSQKWVSDVESARTTPQLDTIEKFARALSVQPFQLLLPEITRVKADSRRILTLFQRCDERSRAYLSRVMESFSDYGPGGDE